MPEAEVDEEWSRRQEVVDKALEDRKKVGILETQVDEVNEPPCGSRGQFEVVIYTVAGGSFMIALSLLVVILLRYVWPPQRKPPDFLPASCRITSTTFENWRECQCGESPSCISEYPCLKLHVEMVYQDHNGTDRVVHTLLFGDLFALAKNQCSVIPSCGANRTVNNEAVRRFDLQWGIAGAALRCYRNVRAPSLVTLRLPLGDAEARAASLQLAICLGFIALLSFTSCLFVALVYGCADCRSFIKRRCLRGKAHLPRAM